MSPGLMTAEWVSNRWALSWAALTAAFALHVVDEASHDFLSWYNPIALRIREAMAGFPFPPVFSFGVWLAGLCLGVLVLAALTPQIKRGRRWAVVLSYAYGLIHTANALAHITVSAAGAWLAPGVLSSPILLAAALWLLAETTRALRHPAAATA